ncbi:MAG: BCCT family transporter [bacterium]|nr:BCCT family transporter [bacterium]
MAQLTGFGDRRGSGNQPARLARVGFPNTSSLIAVGVVATFVIGSAASIETSSATLIGAKDWVVHYLDWMFVGTATCALVGIVGIGFSPLGRVRLGMDQDAPEFGNLAWFAMLLSAGLASGLLYWATAEPVLHFQANPFLAPAGIAAATEAAVPSALRITVLHWGLHGWAFYVVIALAIGIQSHRHGRPLTFRIALYPLLGKRYIDRWPGLAIDLLALFGTVCGVATSIGLAAAGMNATLGRLFGLGVSTTHQVAIVFAVCGLGAASALSGVARGVRRLSEVNVWISLLLLFAVATLGPTLHLGGLLFDTLADYASSFLSVGAWLASTADEQSWQADWTIFYWGWWLAWTPFVGLFIARISKGRSVREVVVGVLLVPALVIVVWMTIFGGTALHQELAETGAVSVAVNQDYSLGIVAVIENLGHPHLEAFLIAVAAFLLFTWMITSLDSATLVLCMLLGAEDAAPAKVFWGIALAAVTCALMLVGGVSALQAASIVVGLPLAIIVLLAGVGLVTDFVGWGR